MVRAAVATIAALLLPPGDPSRREAPRYVVYAWFPAHMDPKINEDWDTRAIDWGALTHICFRAVTIKPDGSIEPGWGTAPDRIRKLTAEAKRHGVKVTVLAWGTSAAGSSKYLARHAEKAADGLLDFVKTYDLDGVNIDDETWGRDNPETGGPNRDLVTDFFRILRRKADSIRSGLHISWASPPVISPEDKFGESWPDFKAVAERLDAFAIMAYCMCPPTAGWTGSAQPVAGGGKVGNHARDFATLIGDYMAATGGRREKLLLGISTSRGGTEWDCRTDKPLSPIVGKPRPLKPEQARANAEKYGRRFDPQQQAPWYCRPRDGGYVQGWYEDDESFAAKLRLVRERDLKGICLWVIDGAREPRETFQLIRRHLSERKAVGGPDGD